MSSKRCSLMEQKPFTKLKKLLLPASAATEPLFNTLLWEAGETDGLLLPRAIDL